MHGMRQHAAPIAVRRAPARLLVMAALTLFLGGCGNFFYYLQSTGGQLELMRLERPIPEMVEDPATPGALKRKLATVLEIREFAVSELRLPDNESYRVYADLKRPYVVWNVFAASEFSVQPEQWCFIMVGCVSYRGYFAKEDADRYAADLARQGYDVYVGPVPAYSTLGWFPDPVLSTFIHYPEADIARLIFHELAHQVVYVRDDTVFNESFAVAVEQEGVRRWLARTGDARAHAAFERRQRIRVDFARLVRQYRDRLDTLYRSRLPPDTMRELKAATLREFEEEYRRIRDTRWDGFAGYDAWMARGLNNAQVASVSLYSQLVPGFKALMQSERGDLARFYTAVRGLAALPREERHAALARYAAQLAREQ